MSVSSEQVLDQLQNLESQWLDFQRQEATYTNSTEKKSRSAEKPPLPQQTLRQTLNSASENLPPGDTTPVGNVNLNLLPQSLSEGKPVPGQVLKKLSQRLLQDVESARRTFLEENQALQLETQQLRSQSREALKDKSVTFQQITESRRELQDLRSVIDALKIDVQYTERRKDVVSNEVAKNEETLSELKVKADEQTQRLNQARETMTLEMNQHKQVMESRERQLQEWELSLAKRQERSKFWEEKLEHAEQLNNKCKERANDLDRKERDLDSKIFEAERNIQEQLRRREDLIRECELYEKHAMELRSNVDALELKKQECEEKVTKCETSILDATRACKKKMDEAANAHAESDHKLMRKKQSLALLDDEIAVRDAKMATMQEEILTTKGQLEQLRTDVSDKMEQLSRLKRDEDRAERHLQKSQEANVKAQEEFAKYKEDARKLVEKSTQLEKSIENSKNKKASELAELRSKSMAELEIAQEEQRRKLIEETNEASSRVEEMERVFRKSCDDWEKQMKKRENDVEEKSSFLEKQEKDIQQRVEKIEKYEREYDRAYSELDDRLSTLEEMEASNTMESKELQKKAQELLLHEQQLQLWKQKLETETLTELKEKSKKISEWEGKLNKKEELLKVSLMELDRKQQEMQNRVEDYNAKAEKFERHSNALQEKRGEIEQKWNAVSRKELELESQARRLSDFSAELDKKSKVLEQYQQEISEKQKEITENMEEIAESRVALQRESLEVSTLREKLEERRDIVEEQMKEAVALKEASEEKAKVADEQNAKAEATLEAAAAWEDHKKQTEESWKIQLQQMEEDKREADKLVLHATQQKNALIASRESLKSIEQALQQRELQLQSTWRQLKTQAVDYYQASTEPMMLDDSVVSEIMTTSLPLNNLNAPPDLQNLKAQDAGLYEFVMNLYHHWSQLITHETKLQKWAHALQVEAAKVETKMKQAKLNEKDISEQMVLAAEKVADADKFEAELKARELTVRREDMAMKRREKNLEAKAKFFEDKENYYSQLEVDMDKKWKEIEKSRYEHEQDKGKHEREWADVKHMMQKVKNWEYEVRRNKEEVEREQIRLRELRSSVEKEKGEVAELSMKLKVRSDKLEIKEETVAGLEKDYEVEKKKKLKRVNAKELQVSRLKQELEREKLELEDQVQSIKKREIALKSGENTLEFEKLKLHESQADFQKFMNEIAQIKRQEKLLDTREEALRESSEKAEKLLQKAEQERVVLEKQKKAHAETVLAIENQLKEEKTRLEKQEAAILEMAKQVSQAKSNADSAIMREREDLDKSLTHLKSEHQVITDEIATREALLKERELKIAEHSEKIEEQEELLKKQMDDLSAREHELKLLEQLLKDKEMKDASKFENAKKELDLVQTDLENSVKQLHAEQVDLKKRRETAAKLEEDLKQQLREAHEQHSDQEAELAKHVEALKNQELALVSKAEKLSEERQILDSEKAQLETKIQSVDEKVANLNVQEQALRKGEEDLKEMRSSMALEVQTLKNEIQEKEANFNARNMQIVTMEKQARQNCDELLVVVAQENDILAKKQKAYEEGKGKIDEAIAKHQIDMENFEKHQYEFNAYTQEAMRQLEEERRITTQHKEELTESIKEEEKLYAELKSKNENLKKIRSDREAKVHKLEDQISAASEALSSLKKNESKFKKAQERYEDVLDMKKTIQKDKENISAKLLELDRKRVLITDIQQKAEQKEAAAKADKIKIEATLNEISDKERSIRQLHRRLRQFEDDLKGKETAMVKKATEFKKNEEAFKKEREIYRVNFQGQEKKLNELVAHTDKMQAELYKSREANKQTEIEIAQMTFSRDEAKEALKESQNEQRHLLSKLEKESIALFKSDARVKELEKKVGVWTASSEMPVHEKFVQEAKKFEQKTESVMKKALESLLEQENKLSKANSHVFILRNMVRFNNEKMNQKEDELKEDKVKYNTIRHEYEKVTTEKNEVEKHLVEVKEKLSIQSDKLSALEESLSAKRIEHEKVSEKLKYIEISSSKLQTELSDVKRSQKEAIKKLEEQQKIALKNQYELQAAQQAESRLNVDNDELRSRRKELEDQVLSMQKTLNEVNGEMREAQMTSLMQTTPMRPIGLRFGNMTAATPGTKLLGTIDSLFGQSASGAPALETGNRLRMLSQVLQKGNRQLKKLKSLVSSATQSESVSSLEEELESLVNNVRALAVDVSGMGRMDTVHPEIIQRVEAQERAASQWENEVQQVITMINSSSSFKMM